MADYQDPDEDEDAAEAAGDSDDDLLEEARAFLSDRIAAESDQRRDALDDLNFVVGDQWPEPVKLARASASRPCLTINKIPTFLHQVTNDQRQNRTSIKVHPVDDEADPKVADVEQGLIRHIEYDSNADVACDTAVNSAAAIGFGYWRLVTEYTAADSFDQDIKFKRIRNPFTVYLGPHTEPDGSDMLKAMITEEIDKAEFKRQYPGKDCDETIQRGTGDGLKQWLTKDKVRLAEFYKVEITQEMLYRVGGQNVFESDVPEGAVADVGKDGKPVQRMSERRKVCWYKMTGVEVLERSEIMCYWIPIFPVYGDEFDVDGKIIRSGLIRHAKGPAQMYNVWMTAATEEIGLRPKIPFIGAVGQFETDQKWKNANVDSYSYMEYDPITADGVMAPPPQRQPMADVPAGVLAMAMHASDDIKATTGIFNASLGQQGNETSGKAIVARQREGDVGSFHYTDNLNRSKRHCARCIVWMIPHYYDTERMVRIMGEDETVEHVQINRQIPQEQQKPDPMTMAIQTVENDLTVGKYDIVLSTGPSYSTLRAETADAMIQVGQQWPQMWAVAGDLLVKNLDWHNADEIADRIKRTIPPNIIGPQDGQQAPLPPEIENLIQQMQGHVQQLEQELQGAKSGESVARIRAESAEKIAEMNNHAKFDQIELGKLADMLIAKMQPPPLLAGAVAEDIASDGGSAQPAAMAGPPPMAGPPQMPAMPQPNQGPPGPSFLPPPGAPTSHGPL